MRLHLTKNFIESEFACPCGCGKVDISLELVEKLQRLRDHYHDPIYISSGVRCPEYNKHIGGYWDSPHLKGLAVDIVARINPVTMAYLADSLGDFRIGIYDRHTHLDIVEPSPSKYWIYKNGIYIYSRNINNLYDFLKESSKYV